MTSRRCNDDVAGSSTLFLASNDDNIYSNVQRATCNQASSCTSRDSRACKTRHRPLKDTVATTEVTTTTSLSAKLLKLNYKILLQTCWFNLRQRCKQQLADQLRVTCHTGHRSLPGVVLLLLLPHTHILRNSLASFIT